MIDNRTAPYAALVIRLALSFFFFAHLIRKFAVIGFDPWWAGLVKQGYPGVVLGYTVAKGLARFDGVFFTHSMRAVAESDPNGGAYHRAR